MPKYLFDVDGASFCLDAEARSFTKDGWPTEPLQTKSFNLLELLVREASVSLSRTVTYDYVLATVWPNVQQPTVGDRNVIAAQVGRINKICGARVISNVKGSGYRLASLVRTEPSFVGRPVPPPNESIVAVDREDLPQAFELVSPAPSIGWKYQGVKGFDVSLGGGVMTSLKATIATDSPYFRFGFKLLERNSRMLGDVVINAADNSVLIHIGRNYAPRDVPKISERDIFLAIYKGGERMGEGFDRKLFQAPRNFVAGIELRVESGKTGPEFRSVSLQITRDGMTAEFHREELDSVLLSRVGILVWGDENGCSVRVSNASCA